MTETPDDSQRPQGEPLPDPTASDWVAPAPVETTAPVDLTQPIDPPVTAALPTPPASPTPPGNPYAAPPPGNPYAGSAPAAPPAYPYGGQTPTPPPPGPPAYTHPPTYGQGTPPNPYAVNPGQPATPVNPYATGGAHGYPHPGGQAPFTYQQGPQRQTNVSAIVLLVLSGLMVCSLVQIPAAILAIVALTKQNDDPAGSRRITKYGWIAFAVGIVLCAVFFGILVASSFTGGTSSDGYSY